MINSTVLVLGATGKSGRRVAARLRRLDRPVRIGSRAANPPFDWDDPTTWPGVLAGIGAVYLAFAPELAMPGAAETVGAFARAAVELGARRLVLLSGRGEENAQRAEEGVFATDGEVTVVRCSFFAQNFDEGVCADAVRYGEIVLPAGAVGEPFVDVDDVAEVAVAALTDDHHVGRTYDVTGPRVLTFAEVAAELSSVIGRPVRYHAGTVAESAAWLGRSGLPPEDAAELAAFFAELLDGRNAHVEDGVAQALGRAPRDFADYARRAAATGARDLDVAS